MKLILTRHGETEENIKGIYQGHLPGKLTEKGIEQAKKLAQRFKDDHIDAIFSSPLARAADTAKEIATLHPNVPFQLADEIKEADLGAYTGKVDAEVDWDNKPDSVETMPGMMKRAKPFIDKVYEEYKDKVVMFIGHGGINGAILRVILNLPAEAKLGHFKHTAVHIVEFHEDKNHKIILDNCIKHLE